MTLAFPEFSGTIKSDGYDFYTHLFYETIIFQTSRIQPKNYDFSVQSSIIVEFKIPNMNILKYMHNVRGSVKSERKLVIPQVLASPTTFWTTQIPRE